MSYVNLSESHQNVKLFYEVHGTGDIKILFIIGLLTDSGAWICQTRFFREQHKYQCVVFDNRGCGRSSTPLTIHYTTVQMAKDALALIEHLQWHQCHVVGVSMGGMIGLELALLAPHKLLSLSLMATHAGGVVSRTPSAGIWHLLRALSLHDKHLQIENALEMLYSQKTLSDPEKRKYFYEYHHQRETNCIPPTIVGIIGQTFAVQRHYISYSDLLKIRYAPFVKLVIVGSEDRLVHEKNSYILQRVLGCRLVKLEHAGHGLSREHGEEINRKLLNLFESVQNEHMSTSTKSKIISSMNYETEIEAIERCCQHRTHCFIYNVMGLVKNCQGLLLGVTLHFLLNIITKKSPLINIHVATCTILIGCLGGMYRATICILRAFRARHFAHKHKLILDQEVIRSGADFLDGNKNGIPYGCGFEFPGLSLLFIVFLLSLLYWTMSFGR